MTRLGRDAEFSEFVQARRPLLRRTAYLLVQDPARAEELTETALVKVYLSWPRTVSDTDIDGHARRLLVHLFLADKPVGRLLRPRRAVNGSIQHEGHSADGPVAPGLITALGSLPARQRAALVLRFYCDLSVAETALDLNCTERTVDTLSARGMDALRSLLRGAADPANDGEPHHAH